MPNYFDLHTHPSLKSFLSGFDSAQRDSCWKTYDHVAEIARSQCSLEQMATGNVRLAVCALYPLEKVFGTPFLIRYVAPMLSPLDEQMIANLATSDYFARLKQEYAHIVEDQEPKDGTGRFFQIIKSMDEYDPDRLNIILAIEGGHCLESRNRTFADTLLELKNAKYRLLYITLTHMSMFNLANHAYGMKLIKSSRDLKPQGAGITDLGWQVIDLAYRRNGDEKSIFIDIKHMSLVARREFYRYREDMGYSDIPIVATHMAVTGISYDPEIVRQYIKRQKCKTDGEFIEVLYDRPSGIGKSQARGGNGLTHFNPWSINLYDEEIPVILNSGGLIGLILDQRVLGASPVKGEYFSKLEFDAWMENRVEQLFEDFEEDEPLDELAAAEELVLEESFLHLNKKAHLRHLCNNILHIAKIGGTKAWEQMCIGSDFDGLIDPINICRDCTRYENLEEDLVEMLGIMIGEAKEVDPNVNFFENDLKRQVRDIMYNNGIRFLNRYFV